jgi:adenosine kinase
MRTTDRPSSPGRTLICGSLAYDTIMVFPDRFARHILPDQAHVLSVSFQIGEMRREWGGCAGNIAYNLAALGGQPVVMATLGDDGAPYRERLLSLGIAGDGVRTVAGTYTAQAFIITDLDDNQITAFHPGAMNASHENRVGDVEGIALGIVAPDGREGMRTHVGQFATAGIPFVFDPGQGMPLFSGPELIEMIDAANYVAVNDYEGRLLAERTGLSLEAIAARVDALIVTLGAEGSRIHADGRIVDVPVVAAQALVDPTGCGDAYRAGLLYGIAHGWDWNRTGRLAATLGSLKIGSRGGQNHAVSRERVEALHHDRFGTYLW